MNKPKIYQLTYNQTTIPRLPPAQVDPTPPAEVQQKKLRRKAKGHSKRLERHMLLRARVSVWVSESEI